MPRFGDELQRLFLKVSNGEGLTPAELDTVRFEGNNAQSFGSQFNGFITGKSPPVGLRPEDVFGVYDHPSAKVNRQSAPQSIDNASWTEVTYDETEFNSGISYDGTSRFTVSESGLYLVMSQVVFAANATGLRNISIDDTDVVSRTARQTINAVDGDSTRLFTAGLYMSKSGNAFYSQGWQNSGGALDLTAARFAIVRLVARPVSLL